MDFVHREIGGLGFSQALKDQILKEVREPVKDFGDLIVAIQGPKMVGCACCQRKDTLATVRTLLVQDIDDKQKIVQLLVKELFKKLLNERALDVFEVDALIFGSNYIQDPMRYLGFMVSYQTELLCELPVSAPEKQVNVEGYNFIPWKPEHEFEASLLIAITDMGELDSKKELPEREPRQRWLAEHKELSGGAINPTISFMATKGNRLVGAIIGMHEGDLGRIACISSPIADPKSKEIEKKLIQMSLSGFASMGVKLVKTVTPLDRRATEASLKSQGFVAIGFRSDALLLASDEAWNALSEEVFTFQS